MSECLDLSGSVCLGQTGISFEQQQQQQQQQQQE